MKDVRKIVKKKGFNLIIIAILLLLVDLLMFSISNEDNSITGLFQDKCLVSSVSDINKCKKKNSYVKISFDEVYDTTYVYQKNNKTVANYLDIDLEGKSLIALVDKTTAQKLLQGEQKYIEGKLVTFYDVDYDALTQIKAYYSSEGIEVDYIGTQFSNYNIDDDYIAVILLVIFTGFILFCFIKAILMITNSENYSYYKLYKDEIDKVNKELNSQYRYQSKGVKLTDHYIFSESKFGFKIYNLEDIKWVYQKNVKRYGITVNKVIVINFIDGKNITIPLKEKEILEQFPKGILVGYTNENIKEYQAIVKEYKVNHK